MQARVPNVATKGKFEDILRASYCARLHGVEGGWLSVGVEVDGGRGARGGCPRSGRGGEASSGGDDGRAVTETVSTNAAQR